VVVGGFDLVNPELLRRIRVQYALPWRGIHGVTHWARVLENGLRLAGITGARPPVVALFAIFHDSVRFNESWDPHHGRRGAALAATLRGPSFTISDGDFALLRFACERHTEGFTEADVTIQTCWDADRLDLGRVGIRPERHRLCTPAAREEGTLQWAHERSLRRHEPEFVTRVWGEG
jgi:uncharacterized protein